MNLKRTLISAAVFASCGSQIPTAMSSSLVDGVRLTIDAGVPVFDAYGNQTNVSSGSYFGMDLNGNSKIGGTEKTILSQGTEGIVIGRETSAGASHTGGIQPGDTNEVDAPWEFSGNTGSSQFVPGSGGPTEISSNPPVTTIDWSGFVVNWNGTTINMGGGNAWTPQNCAALGCDDDGTGNPVVFNVGEAVLEWSGTYGEPYVLHFASVVPSGSFSGTQYYLHFEGIVEAPPNNAPVANNFSASGLENTTFDINIISNTSDADGNIDTSSIAITNSNACATLSDPENDGIFTFPACTAGTYTFDYTISDTLGATSNTATVTVNISANPAPNVSPDSATTNGTTAVQIDVLSNDTDNTGIDATTVTVTTPPTNGNITNIDVTTGAITYQANAGFSGTDSFAYTVEDDSGTNNVSAPATVTIIVNATNTPSSSAILQPGTIAQNAQANNGVITADDIGIPDTGSSPEQGVSRACIGGCFDFTLTGFSGPDAKVILPLSEAIPTPAEGETLQYRKLIDGAWRSFNLSGNNAIHTAPGTLNGNDVICPPADDIVYDNSPSLTPGHYCVRLTIEDNTGAGDGPNDSDGSVGTIADPGGVATTTTIDTRIASTDGCSITHRSSNTGSLLERAEWILIATFLAALSIFRKRKEGGKNLL